MLREHLPYVRDRLIGIVSRGGSLLASMMSTLPLLNRFDPLAIIYTRPKEEDDDNDDQHDKAKKPKTVDDLFDNQRRDDDT